MVSLIHPPLAHLVFITQCGLVAMVSDKRLLNTKNTLATLGSLLKSHLSMSSSRVVNRNSCVLQHLLAGHPSLQGMCSSRALCPLKP